MSSSRGPEPGKRLRRAVAAAAVVTLAGCAQPLAYPPSAPPTGKRAPPKQAEFKAGDLLKSDVDAAAELHLKESLASARLLMEKLYRRNPRELRKSGHASLEPAVERAFDPRYGFRFPELKGARGTAAIQLALKPEYEGDRVFAFSVGLAGMILQAYGDKTEVYLTDSLDPQKLYNAARNVEIAAWKLANARDAQGRLLILSNDMAGEAPNLSFEREIGKLIGYQDVMAQVAAQRTNRTIRRSVQFIATAVFLPI